MFASPQVGTTYRQEYYFDEAGVKVVATGITATVPFGAFANCVKIEGTALESGKAS